MRLSFTDSPDAFSHYRCRHSLFVPLFPHRSCFRPTDWKKHRKSCIVRFSWGLFQAQLVISASQWTGQGEGVKADWTGGTRRKGRGGGGERSGNATVAKPLLLSHKHRTSSQQHCRSSSTSAVVSTSAVCVSCLFYIRLTDCGKNVPLPSCSSDAT